MILIFFLQDNIYTILRYNPDIIAKIGKLNKSYENFANFCSSKINPLSLFL